MCIRDRGGPRDKHLADRLDRSTLWRLGTRSLAYRQRRRSGRGSWLSYASRVNDVIEAEGVTRVLRTFAFVDVSGFTAFTDREGDAAAVVLLDSIRGIIRRLASVHGVRIAKWLGDGAMLVGVEPEPVIEALVSIVEENRALTSCLLYTSPSPRDATLSRMPSSA